MTATAVARPILGRLLEVSAAATYLDMTEARLRRHIRARRVRVLRADRKVQIYERWLDEFRERFTVEPTGDSRGVVTDAVLLPERPLKLLMPAVRQLRVR